MESESKTKVMMGIEIPEDDLDLDAKEINNLSVNFNNPIIDPAESCKTQVHELTSDPLGTQNHFLDHDSNSPLQLTEDSELNNKLMETMIAEALQHEIVNPESKIEVEGRPKDSGVNLTIGVEMNYESTNCYDSEFSNDAATEHRTDQFDVPGSNFSADTNLENNTYTAPPKQEHHVQHIETDGTNVLEVMPKSSETCRKADDLQSPPSDWESVQCESKSELSLSLTQCTQLTCALPSVEEQTELQIEVGQLSNRDVVRGLEDVESHQPPTDGQVLNNSKDETNKHSAGGKELENPDFEASGTNRRSADDQKVENPDSEALGINNQSAVCNIAQMSDGAVSDLTEDPIHELLLDSESGLDVHGDLKTDSECELDQKMARGNIEPGLSIDLEEILGSPKAYQNTVKIDDEMSHEVSVIESTSDNVTVHQQAVGEDAQGQQLESESPHSHVAGCMQILDDAIRAKSAPKLELFDQSADTETKFESEKMLKSSDDQHSEESGDFQARDVTEISDDDNEPDNEKSGCEELEYSESFAHDQSEELGDGEDSDADHGSVMSDSDYIDGDVSSFGEESEDSMQPVSSPSDKVYGTIMPGSVAASTLGNQLPKPRDKNNFSSGNTCKNFEGAVKSMDDSVSSSYGFCVDDKTQSYTKSEASKSIEGDVSAKVRVRHPNCNYSLDELNKMSLKLGTKTLQRNFVSHVYCKGVNPDRLMRLFLLVHDGSPRNELNRIAEVLPTQGLKQMFKRKVKKGANPDHVIKMLLNQPGVKEMVLLKKLGPAGDINLLRKVLQQPAPPRDNKSMECDKPGSVTSKLAGKIAAPSTSTVTVCKNTEPEISQPSNLTVIEWFSHFLQVGMSVDVAFSKVKKMLMQSFLMSRQSDQGGLNPNVTKPANTSMNIELNAGISETKVVLSRKAKKRRKAWFQLILGNDEQKKAYCSLRDEGMVHDIALTRVLDRFYPRWKPAVASSPLSAKSASRPNIDKPGEANKMVRDTGESGSFDRVVSGIKRNRPLNARRRIRKKNKCPDGMIGCIESPLKSNSLAISVQGDASTLPRTNAWSGQSVLSVPGQGWEKKPRSVPGPERSSYNQSSCNEVSLQPNILNVEKEDRFSTLHSTFKQHTREPAAIPAFSNKKRENPIVEHGVHKMRKFTKELEHGWEPSWTQQRTNQGLSTPEQSSYDDHHGSRPSSYSNQYPSTSQRRENVYQHVVEPKRIRFEGPTHIQQLPPHPAESLSPDEQDPEPIIRFKRPLSQTQHLPHLTAEMQQCEQDPALSGDTLHVFIVPSGYPRERFSDEQIDAVENGILTAILEIDDYRMKPSFNGSFRNKGRFEVICQDQPSRTWLNKYLSWFEPWPNASLRIIPAKEETKIQANVLLPLCKNDNIDRIMKFIAKQNSYLHVGEWDVVQRQDSDWNTRLSLLIDQESAEILKSSSKIHFKLGIGDIELVEDRTKDQDSSVSCSNESGTLRGVSNSIPPGWADEVSSSSPFSQNAIPTGNFADVSCGGSRAVEQASPRISFSQCQSKPNPYLGQSRLDQPRQGRDERFNSGTAFGAPYDKPASSRTLISPNLYTESSKSHQQARISYGSSDFNEYGYTTIGSCHSQASPCREDRLVSDPSRQSLRPSSHYPLSSELTAHARNSRPDEVIISGLEADVMTLSSRASGAEQNQRSKWHSIVRSQPSHSGATMSKSEIPASETTSVGYVDAFGRNVSLRDVEMTKSLQCREPFQPARSSSNVSFNKRCSREQNVTRPTSSPCPEPNHPSDWSAYKYRFDRSQPPSTFSDVQEPATGAVTKKSQLAHTQRVGSLSQTVDPRSHNDLYGSYQSSRSYLGEHGPSTRAGAGNTLQAPIQRPDFSTRSMEQDPDCYSTWPDHPQQVVDNFPRNCPPTGSFFSSNDEYKPQ